MASVNKVILIGHLGNDPEVRYTQSGDAVANVSIATSESWKDKNSGEQKELTEWHRVVFFRRLAEIVGQYLKKGAQVYVEGRIRARKWTDKEGQDRYTTEIEAHEMKMLGKREESAPAANADPGRSYRMAKEGRDPTTGRRMDDAFDDDIPF